MKDGEKNNETQSRAEDDRTRLYNVDTLRNEIIEHMFDYVSDPINEIDGRITDCPQFQFEAMIAYVGRSLVIPSRICATPNGRHNIYVVNVLCDLFIELCNKYAKIPSVYGFASLTGIDEETLKSWAHIKRAPIAGGSDSYIHNMHYDCINIHLLENNGGLGADELTALRATIAKKLRLRREEGLKNRLISSSNPVGSITVGNTEFSWSAQNVAQETKAKALTLSELPQIMLTAENKNILSDDKETL